MGRQLFLHHYLPAHLASALVTGALVEFVVNVDPVVVPVEGGKAAAVTKNPSEQAVQPRERLGESSVLATWAAAGLVLTLVIGGWYFFLPLTYGKPGLSVEQVVARKWMGYDLHFAK